ncbi:F17d-G fimbrial adhesin [Burkholderia lata]|nr:F17d-G fimbrial adhesin [Burkholderia lata]
MLAPAPLLAANCKSSLSSITVSSAALNASGPADQKRPGNVIGKNSDVPPLYRFGDLSTCTKSFKREMIVNGNVVPGIKYNNQTVYESGIPGIGFAFSFSRWQWQPNGAGGGLQMPINDPITVLEQWSQSNAVASVGGDTWTVTWIVTGRLQPGTYMRPTLLATIRHTGDGIPGSIDVPIHVPAKATLTTSGCSMATGSLPPVKLSGVSTQSLGYVGAESPPIGQFSIGLQCDPNVSVYATMTDVSNPANVSDTLGLYGDSAASGFGLKLYWNGQSTAVKFGPDSSTAGTTNQWFVGKSSSNGGTFSLPFSVRYVKTAQNGQIGTLRAGSSITFSYQ